MTPDQLLKDARDRLAAAGIEDARLESEILLMHVLGCDRVQLYIGLNSDLPEPAHARFVELVGRRLRGEPSAYITGRREFYGLDFIVNDNVLIPRPETELIIEKALALAAKHEIKSVVDIGAGSGAIAVTLAKLLPQATVYAVDISAGAIAVAGVNAERHDVADRVKLVPGDLLSPVTWPVDLIVANLPYVRTGDIPAAGPLSFEPRLALDGGPDGLDALRRFVAQLATVDFKHLLMEVGMGQAQAVAATLRGRFPEAMIGTAFDLGGIERLVSIEITSQPAPASVRA